MTYVHVNQCQDPISTLAEAENYDVELYYFHMVTMFTACF